MLGASTRGEGQVAGPATGSAPAAALRAPRKPRPPRGQRAESGPGAGAGAGAGAGWGAGGRKGGEGGGEGGVGTGGGRKKEKQTPFYSRKALVIQRILPTVSGCNEHGFPPTF